jgi:hypothetical protein
MREAAGAQILSQQQVQFLSSGAWPELINAAIINCHTNKLFLPIFISPL